MAVLVVFVTLIALVAGAATLPGKLWLYCLIALVLELVPAAIGAVAILNEGHIHWTLLAVDFASGVLLFASLVGLAVWSRMVNGK